MASHSGLLVEILPGVGADNPSASETDTAAALRTVLGPVQDLLRTSDVALPDTPSRSTGLAERIIKDVACDCAGPEHVARLGTIALPYRTWVHFLPDGSRLDAKVRNDDPGYATQGLCGSPCPTIHVAIRFP